MNDFEVKLSQERNHLAEERRKKVATDIANTQQRAYEEVESMRNDGTDPSLIVGETNAILLTEYINYMKSNGMRRAKFVDTKSVRGYIIGKTNLQHDERNYTYSAWPKMHRSETVFSGVEIFELNERFTNEIGCSSHTLEYNSRAVLICEDNRLRTSEGKNIYQQYDKTGRKLLIFAPGEEIIINSNDLDENNRLETYFAYVPLPILLPVIAARDLGM